MTPESGPIHFAPPCRKCWGLNGVHSMRCPAVNLKPGWYSRVLEQDKGDGSYEDQWWRSQE